MRAKRTYRCNCSVEKCTAASARRLPPRWCTPTMCRAMASSRSGLDSSTMMKNRSKRDMMGADTATLALRGLERSYRPKTGLAAARMDARALSVAWMPALVIEMVCCSIACTHHRGVVMISASGARLTQQP